MSAPQFLGLSTGRAGSRYFTHLLNAIGIPTLHEKNFSPSAWDAQGGHLGEVSAHLVVHANRWPNARVWHFTRHPQPFVTSLVKFGFWRMNAPAIHPFLRRTGNDLADSYGYWCNWNRRILAVEESRRTTFRIEDLDVDRLDDLAVDIGAEADTSDIDPHWDEKQKFAPIPESVASEVGDLMEQLGYQPKIS